MDIKTKQILYELTPPFIFKRLRKLKENKIKREASKQLTGEQLIIQKQESIKGIFIPIHKCGSSSLTHAISQHPNLITCMPRPGNWRWKTGREHVPENIFNNAIKFTLVRNPYARVVSAYKMFKSNLLWNEVFHSFEHFVDFIRWTDVHHQFPDKEIEIIDHTKDINTIIDHCSSFDNPKYMIDDMDFIGKLENIEDDIKSISNMIDIPPIKVYKLNSRGGSKDYRSYYHNRTKQIITNIYRSDIERFGYSF